MAASLFRVLIVEDNPTDAELMVLALEQAGFIADITRVQTEEDYLANLKLAPDIILCDYSLPQFDAMRALELLREQQSEIPFLIVSGSIGEDTAVEAIKRGAHDYILKDRLGRLGSAVSHALEERKLRDAERQTREALRASEAQYRALADSIPHIVWTAQPDGALEYVNQRTLESSGLKDTDITGWSWERLIHPEDLARNLEVWRSVLNTGKPQDLESRIRRADGTYRWHLTRQVAIRDASGAITRWFGTCTDVDDQKAAVAQLARDSLLLANVRDSVVVTDLSGIVTYWNEGATRLFGWTAAEMLGHPYADRFPEPTRSEIAAEIKQRAGGSEWYGEFEDFRKDGSRVWIDARVARITNSAGQLIGILGVSHDITDRKQAERQLQRKQSELQLIFDTVPAVIFYKDLDHRLVRVNNELVRLVGLPREALEGRTDLELGSPQAAQYSRDEEDVIATGRAKRGIVEPIATTTGVRWLQTDKLPHRDESGNIVGVIGFAIDITERKQAEESFRQAQERLQHVIASSPAVLFSLAIEGDHIRGIAWMSENVQDVLGYSSTETAGTEWWAANIHPEDREQVLASTEQELIAKGRTSHEYRFRHRNGKYRWLRSEIRLVLDATGESVEAIGSWSDITERQLLEEQYRQAQKMEAFGQLAAGVAHDFNNLLTVINGYSDILVDELSQIDPRRTSVTAIRNAGDRAAALTAQLLAFSRKTVVEPKVLDLNELINRVGKMLRRLIGEDITLITDLAPELRRVKADQGQMEQIIMNLAVNARDAMPKGGRLTIESQNVETRTEASFNAADGTPTHQVRLAVTDTGIGMTDEVKSKIFEPFFTTKEVGKGTGLGLATVFGIVNQAGGQIEVTSEVGVGTRVTILLPANFDAIIQPASVGPVPSKGGTETILLVEDEQLVRRFTKQALEIQGYKVLDAGNAAEALRIVEQYDQVIHMLLTDVVMPGMGGRELAEDLRLLWPSLRVLYTSGYTDDAVIRRGVREEIDAFLPKPFTPLGLTQKVRAVLDASG